MPKRVTVVVTSDRYGGASAEFDIEREVIALYPDLEVDLRGAEPKTAADMIALGQDADALNPRPSQVLRACGAIGLLRRVEEVDRPTFAQHALFYALGLRSHAGRGSL